MRLLDLRHPFFNPLWRRIVTVLICTVWAGVELGRGSAGWAALFAGLALVSSYTFFLTWRPQPPRDRD